MVSEHAMLMLILLLAVAVVVLATGLTIYAAKMDARLKRIEERDAAQSRPAPQR